MQYRTSYHTYIILKYLLQGYKEQAINLVPGLQPFHGANSPHLSHNVHVSLLDNKCALSSLTSLHLLLRWNIWSHWKPLTLLWAKHHQEHLHCCTSFLFTLYCLHSVTWLLSLLSFTSFLINSPLQDFSPTRAIICSYTVHAMAAIMVLLSERGTAPLKNPWSPCSWEREDKMEERGQASDIIINSIMQPWLYS